MKLCLVTSAGGHFFQIYQLKAVWERHERFWVTFNKPDINSLIPTEKKYIAHYPESRHILNAVKNLFLAFSIISKEKPTHLLSIGAGIAVPSFFVAKLKGIKTIYIEPIDFIYEPSLTGKIIYTLHLADLLLIQTEMQQPMYPKAKHWGGTL